MLIDFELTNVDQNIVPEIVLKQFYFFNESDHSRNSIYIDCFCDSYTMNRRSPKYNFTRKVCECYSITSLGRRLLCIKPYKHSRPRTAQAGFLTIRGSNS